MDESAKDKNRLKILEKIEELEKNGDFDKDVEEDPPCLPLKPEEVDFLNKKFSSKIKNRFANFFAKKYFYKLKKDKKYIYKGVLGLDNLKEFKGGALITCNHMNMVDNFIVYMGLKEYYKKLTLYKLIREGNYALPGKFGFFMRNCNTLPISENKRTMINCMHAVETLLKKGKKILIYPEQGMWWNYRKPRPLKNGAFRFAVKNNVPVIPCFITLNDSDIIGEDGYAVQEFTLHILPLIYPDNKLTYKENYEQMKNKNFEAWKELYEKVYDKKLSYQTEEI